MIRAVSTLCLVASASLALGGCGAFDRKKSAPDEFRVVAHSPLVMPPNAELRPPRPGAPRPQETSPSEKAKDAILGGVGARPAPATGSPAEALLVREVEAKRPADPAIRQTVNEESKVIADSDRSFVDTLIFWREPPPPGVAVDPAKEQQRLREGQATGVPSEANTPQIQRRRRGLLEGLF
jgi:hypothetical protein